jgi:hypothetical protein
MRTVTALATAATLIWGTPVLAANGTLTYDGKTIAVQEISGGVIYANSLEGGTQVDQILVEVDARGFNDLRPLIDIMIKGGEDMPNLTLSAEGQTHSLLGVRVTGVLLPTCTAQTVDAPLIQVSLSASMIKSSPELKTTAPVNLRPTAATTPLTGCSIAISGAPVTAEAVLYPIIISREFEQTGVGELRDYDKSDNVGLPYSGGITLKGQTLNAWARKDLMLGTQGKASVTITYATASGPALILIYPETQPDSASLVGGETALMATSVILAKP